MKWLELRIRATGALVESMENLSAELLSGTNIVLLYRVEGYPILACWAWSECIDWLVWDGVHAALANLGRLWRGFGDMDTNRDIKWIFRARLADLPRECGPAQRSLCSQDFKETHEELRCVRCKGAHSCKLLRTGQVSEVSPPPLSTISSSTPVQASAYSADMADGCDSANHDPLKLPFARLIEFLASWQKRLQ
jgi:hypothetical protein